jgi:hypothetical protein
VVKPFEMKGWTGVHNQAIVGVIGFKIEGRENGWNGLAMII